MPAESSDVVVNTGPLIALAAEALGMVKGHLESLEELPVDPTASTVIGSGGGPAYDND